MNSRYLGDALDHWKGSLFSYLRRQGALQDLIVDPMLTDAAAWRPQDVAIYAKLLQVSEDQILHHDVTIRNRPAYFEEITHRGDIFLDPDTGVATCRVSRPEQYVHPSELDLLLSDEVSRLVFVYQHIRGKKTRARVDVVVSKLPSGCAWGTYESGTVAMLFLSLEPKRVENVAHALRSFLGPHAEGRIRNSVNIPASRA